MKCGNFLKRISLSNKQKQINKMFEEEGLTDEILKRQIQLNKEKHEHDIHDPSEIIDNEDGCDYVQ